MIVLSMMLAAATVQDAPVPREAHVFNDWVVACDNTRRCQAVGLIPENQPSNPNGVLFIERGPEPDAPLRLRLTQVEGTPARLAVHSQALPVRLVEEDGDYRVELQDVTGFLSSTIYAEELVLQDASGTSIGQLSLDGLSGAMLYMDEVQGRLHTPTALIRTGRRPSAGIPPAPPVPIVRLAAAAREAPLAIPAARIRELRRETECTIENVGGPDEVSVAALGGGRTLVLLACGSGAYNVSNVPFIATRRGREIRIEPAPFDVPLEQWEEEEGHRVLVNGAWDAETMTLQDFSKGRGFGDCGSRSTYGWDGQRFRLITREEMPECRGSYVYVTTWRVDVAR